MTRLARARTAGHPVVTHVATGDDMASVGIRQLKHDTSAILRRVREKHETVDVTHRGRVVARIVPVHADADLIRREKAVWRKLDEVAKEIGARWPSGMTAVKALGRRG